MGRRRPIAAIVAALAIPASAWSQAELFIHRYLQVDEHVLRGAQPSVEGLRALAANHVKTVLDLRAADEKESGEKREVEKLGMRYVNVSMSGFHAPKDTQMEKALATLDDPAAWPVFVHCQFGVDRTGTVIACYRMKHDGWDNRKALSEAKKLGMHGWETGMKQYILAFDGTPARQASTR